MPLLMQRTHPFLGVVELMEQSTEQQGMSCLKNAAHLLVPKEDKQR
jgi:hypothetical protein